MTDSVLIGGEYTVKRIGLGTNRIENNDASKEALKKALELGYNFIDTAAAYTGGMSEQIVGDTLSPHQPEIIIATKGGMHAPDFHVDSHPDALKLQLEASLKKLQLETIPLYFLHRVDPHVSLKESVQFLKKMQEEGKIKHIGLSDVTVEQITEAQSYAEIVAVENEYNLVQREHEAVIDYCEKNNIVFIPWYPLGRGDLSTFTATLKVLAERYNATNAQIALAWLLKRSPIMLPIPGSLSPAHLEENFGALSIELTNDDFASLHNS
jgi:pyridoxine 4-dehydrogenase